MPLIQFTHNLFKMIQFLPNPFVDPTYSQWSKIILILNPFSIKPHRILPKPKPKPKTKPKHMKRHCTTGCHLSCCDPSPPLAVIRLFNFLGKG